MSAAVTSAKALAKSRKRGAAVACRGRGVGIKRALCVVAPSLECLPHPVVVQIMSLLCVVDRLRMARVCKRFRELSADVDVWESNDLSSLYRVIDASKLSVFLNRYCFPTTRSLTLKHTAVGSKASIYCIFLTYSIFDSLLPQKCPNLTELLLFRVNLRWHSVRNLYPLSSLKHLHLEYCDVHDQELFFTELDLSVDEGLNPLPHLDEICLLSCSHICLDDLQAIVNAKKSSLRSIKLRNVYRIGPMTTISTIAEECTNLKEFWLESMPIPLSQDLHSPQLALFPRSLTALSLKGMIKCCTKDGINRLSTILPHLKYLDLRDCENVEDGLEEETRKAFPELVQLFLT